MVVEAFAKARILRQATYDHAIGVMAPPQNVPFENAKSDNNENQNTRQYCYSPRGQVYF